MLHVQSVDEEEATGSRTKRKRQPQPDSVNMPAAKDALLLLALIRPGCCSPESFVTAATRLFAILNMFSSLILKASLVDLQLGTESSACTSPSSLLSVNLTASVLPFYHPKCC